MENAGLYGVSLLTPDRTFNMKRQKQLVISSIPELVPLGYIERRTRHADSSPITLPSTHHLRISAEV